MILTSVEGQTGLPRYFSRVFAMAQEMQRGRVDFVLPDGRTFRAEGAEPGPVAELRIHNDDLFSRLIREGDLGFCDAYLDEWWSTPDLQAFMDLVHADNENVYDGFPGQGLVRMFEKFRFWMQRNHKTQARKNISYHYDLGNEFYGLWLDDTMTYSSALFEDGAQQSTEAAQIAKYKSMVDQGFAEYAAKERGLRVTGLTISEEQFKYAKERIEKAGLSDVVDFKLQDYRDETGVYDGIASIEMFEAVGEKYWPAYFDTVRERLKPGTNAGTCTSAGWISSRNTSFRAVCCPAPRSCASRSKRQASRWTGPSSLARAMTSRCAAGTRPSTKSGTRSPKWALMTGSGGCGIFTSLPVRRHLTVEIVT